MKQNSNNLIDYIYLIWSKIKCINVFNLKIFEYSFIL